MENEVYEKKTLDPEMYGRNSTVRSRGRKAHDVRETNHQGEKRRRTQEVFLPCA
jgi:hypothetical protein